MKKKKKVRFSPGKTLGLSMVGILLGGLLGIGSSVTYALIDVKTDEKKTQSVSGIVYDDFQIHFMELGNIYAGDSIFIKAGENDILIDAGSRASSGTTIRNYIDRYCEDGKLEYVIATHAHQDHIAAFGCTDGIFYSYSIGTIIDFPLTNSQTGTYRSYLSGRAYAIRSPARFIILHWIAGTKTATRNGRMRLEKTSRWKSSTTPTTKRRRPTKTIIRSACFLPAANRSFY